jgi:hypothetical protein
LNFAYFFPIVSSAFFAPTTPPLRYNEANLALVLPLVITAVVSVFLGCAPNAGLAFYQLAWEAATSVMAGSTPRLAGGAP